MWLKCVFGHSLMSVGSGHIEWNQSVLCKWSDYASCVLKARERNRDAFTYEL